MSNDKQIALELCMGSSCFARGNKDALPLITALIEEEGTNIALKGHLCVDHCSNGPLIRIDGETYSGVSPEAAVDLLRNRSEE